MQDNTLPPNRTPAEYQMARYVASRIFSLDFETYSEAGYNWVEHERKWKSVSGGRGGIFAVGAAAYAAHPSTEILALSYGPPEYTETWLPGMPLPQPLIEHIASGGIISGQNVMFEYWVWLYVLHMRQGWPVLPLTQILDTAAVCRAYGAPGALGAAGEMLLPEHLRKTESVGKALIRKFSVPQPPTVKQPDRRRIYMADHPIDAANFIVYNQQDKVAEGALLEHCPPLITDEQKMWQLDAKINDRGVKVDVPGMQRCIEWANYHTMVGNAELQKLTGGDVSAATELKNMGDWVERRGVKLKRTKKGAYQLDDDATTALLKRPLAPDIKRVIELRQQLAGAAIKKLFAMSRMLSPEDRLRGTLEYWGAHTGRWAGRGVQVHNFPKDSVKVPGGWTYDAAVDNVIFNTQMSMLDVKKCLRGLLVAGEGKELISSDYNAIEAVVSAVLAGEEWRLQVFHTHGKIYEESASRITGVPFEEMIAYKKRTGEHHPDRNRIGKYAELASGFGGWLNAWKNFGADAHLSDKQIISAIKAWRAASPKIVEMWGGQWRQVGDTYSFYPECYGLEGAWVTAMFNPGIPQQVGKYLSVQYYPHEDVMRIHLPSGRSLVYQQPRLEPGRHNFSKNPQWKLSYLGYKEGRLCRIDTYGGKLFENCVQAVARDRLRDAMILLEDNGYPIVLHVHDEPTAEVTYGFGSVEEYEQIMLSPASWCHDWPIRASGGWRGRRYRK